MNKLTTFPLGNYGTTIGMLLDEMQRELPISGKKAINMIYIKHKDQIWQIKLISKK